MNVYFISDYHFNHANIIKYCNRPFDDVKEMNKTLIRNHNKVVKKNDMVFILGDFCLGNRDVIKYFANKLHGRKILILGNHDGYNPKFYESAGFEEVYKYPILYKGFFLLSHEPAFINENCPYINIYGHIHNNPMYKTYTSQSFCVSAERINYKPISFDEIKESISNYGKYQTQDESVSIDL